MKSILKTINVTLTDKYGRTIYVGSRLHSVLDKNKSLKREWKVVQIDSKLVHYINVNSHLEYSRDFKTVVDFLYVVD